MMLCMLVLQRGIAMEKRRKYHVIIGSCNYFDKVVASFLADHDVDYFMDLVKRSDECKRNGSPFYDEASFLILKNNNYHGIVETAHDRLGSLIEELTVVRHAKTKPPFAKNQKIPKNGLIYHK